MPYMVISEISYHLFARSADTKILLYLFLISRILQHLNCLITLEASANETNG